MDDQCMIFKIWDRNRRQKVFVVASGNNIYEEVILKGKLIFL